MKPITKLFAALVLLGGATTFASCSSDDDDNNGGGYPDTQTTPVVIYSIEVSNDMLALADVVVTYWNADGQQKRDTLKQTAWEVSFSPTMSQQVGYSVSTTAKENLDELLTKDRYSLGMTHYYLSAQLNKNNEETDLNGTLIPEGGTSTIIKDKVAEYLTDHYQFNTSHHATYDKATNKFSEWGE